MTEITTKQAVDHLCEQLVNDPDYRMSWQANIAVPFQDEWQRAVDSGGLPATREQIHAISNKAADYFLWLLTKNHQPLSPTEVPHEQG